MTETHLSVSRLTPKMTVTRASMYSNNGGWSHMVKEGQLQLLPRMKNALEAYVSSSGAAIKVDRFVPLMATQTANRAPRKRNSKSLSRPIRQPPSLIASSPLWTRPSLTLKNIRAFITPEPPSDGAGLRTRGQDI